MDPLKSNSTDLLVWTVSIQDHGHRVPDFFQLLEEEEREKARKYYFDQDRLRYVIAHGTLRIILGRYLNVPPKLVQFDRLPGGKPVLGERHRSERLIFNISHSQDLVLIGVAEDKQRDIGVDVEWVRSESFPLEIADRYFSLGELAYLNSLPFEEKQMGFFRIWTRKEAYIKGLGAGLAVDLTSFDVSQKNGVNIVVLNEERDAGSEEKWKIVDLDLGPEYAGAVAGKGIDWTLTSSQFDPAMIPAGEQLGKVI